MRDLHIRVDDDTFERWQTCAKHYGQRSHIMRKLIKQAIEYLEKQLEPEVKLTQPKPPKG